MDVSVDQKTFRDAIESMERVLKNGKLTKISNAVFDSAVATVNEISLRRVNDIEVSSKIKYAIDEIKTNFEKYQKFSSLSIGSMYHQKCAEKVEALDYLYKNFEALSNKKRPSTLTIDSFKAIRVSLYGDQNTCPTDHKHDESNFETKLEKIESEGGNNCNELSIPKNILLVESKSIIQNTTTASSKVEPPVHVEKVAECINEYDESNFETKLEKIEGEVGNNCNELSIPKNILLLESKSIIQNTTTASSKIEPPVHVEKVAECINEYVSNVQPNNTIPENISGEFTNPIQDEKISLNNSNGSSSVSSIVSSVEEEEFQSVVALEEKLKEKAKELANRTKEISALIEERKNNKMAYHELKLANKEFKKRQEALSNLQDEVFMKFPQNFTEMLSSHHQLIREEFAELKNNVKNLAENLLTANKDLRQHKEAQELTINLMKSELESLKTTMKDALRKKDEEIEQLIGHFNELLKANEKCEFCSNQTDKEESGNKKAKARTTDKINVDEDSLEEI